MNIEMNIELHSFPSALVEKLRKGILAKLREHGPAADQKAVTIALTSCFDISGTTTPFVRIYSRHHDFELVAPLIEMAIEQLGENLSVHFECVMLFVY